MTPIGSQTPRSPAEMVERSASARRSASGWLEDQGRCRAPLNHRRSGSPNRPCQKGCDCPQPDPGAWRRDRARRRQEFVLREHPETGDARDHFGYRDGVSQPGLRGRASATEGDWITPRENPANPNHGKPGQELVWPGEFVFGYPDQDGRFESSKTVNWMTGCDGFALAPKWAKDGSYLVYRRLRQYVHRFHESVQDDLDGARIVGRWFTGTPIVNAPTANSLADANANNNDFFFEEGVVDVCPGNAHIRKVNPRGEFELRERSKHRLLRRGITSGKRSKSTPAAPVNDGAERGLLFLAYMTSIKYQFEFVMKSWANHRDFHTAGSAPTRFSAGTGSSRRVAATFSRRRYRR